MNQQYIAKLEKLNQLLGENIINLLDELGIKHKNCGEYISMACPIHNSNSPRSLSIVISQFSPYVNTWSCWSKHCHEKYGKTILGFIHGVLNHKNKLETINWTLKFLGIKNINDLEIPSLEILKKNNLLNSTT